VIHWNRIIGEIQQECWKTLGFGDLPLAEDETQVKFEEKLLNLLMVLDCGKNSKANKGRISRFRSVGEKAIRIEYELIADRPTPRITTGGRKGSDRLEERAGMHTAELHST
jgi:hypothetical protein